MLIVGTELSFRERPALRNGVGVAGMARGATVGPKISSQPVCGALCAMFRELGLLPGLPQHGVLVEHSPLPTGSASHSP